MVIGAGEALVLLGLVAALFGLTAPLRRRLERWIARRLARGRSGSRGRVVVLERRSDGTFGREDRDGG